MRATALTLLGALLGGVTSCALLARIETFERATADASVAIGDGPLLSLDNDGGFEAAAPDSGRDAAVIGYVAVADIRAVLPAPGSVFVSADFWPPSVTGCTTTNDPPCETRVCSESRTYASAGTIRITSTGTAVSLEPSGDNSYGMVSGGSDGGLTPSSMLSFAAEGAEIAAFQGSVVPPAAVSFTTPPSGPISYGPAGVSIAWVGGAPSDEIAGAILGTSSSDQSASVTVDCRFDATKGSGTIPAAVLDRIASGATLTFAVRSRARVAAGANDVELMVDAVGVYGQLSDRQ